MSTLLITYTGEPSTRFDREYYVNIHLPLVMKGWGPYGLESLAAFFPAGHGAGTIAICVCKFRDEAAIVASLGSQATEDVMGDIPHFTDASPSRSRVVPFENLPYEQSE